MIGLSLIRFYIFDEVKRLKKRILIVGASVEGRNAVSQIMSRIITQNNDECEFFLFGYDYGSVNNQQNKNAFDLKVPDPYTLFRYRFARKLLNMFHMDQYKLTSKYEFSRLNWICEGKSFDQVVAVSGLFCHVATAFRYAKMKSIPLSIVYFDPFVENRSTRNKKKRASVEARWFEYATFVYCNEENVLPSVNRFREKIIPFKIPIEVSSEYVDDNNSKDIVYGGMFYQDIRTPDGVYTLARQIAKSDYQITCYSNLQNERGAENLRFLPLIGAQAFAEKCKTAAALIYVGNRGGNSKSSKYLEFVALKKPIIGIQVETDNEVRNYPFYIDASLPNLIERLNMLRHMNREEYDPYKTYPDRDPRALFVKLFLAENTWTY